MLVKVLQHVGGCGVDIGGRPLLTSCLGVALKALAVPADRRRLSGCEGVAEQ